jgi:Rad3-related DNA helicase
MDGINAVKIDISVRDLVEFILRAGDLDNRYAHGDMGAMQEGSRLHRKLQKAAGDSYRAEVMLKHEAPVEYDGESFLLCVQGRADGIFFDEGEVFAEAGMYVIDEIKTTLRNVAHMQDPVPVHRSQAMCYAYIYALQNGLERIGIRMTYCNQETEDIKYFSEAFEFAQLAEWFDKLIKEYAKWAAWQAKWLRARNASIAAGSFPFEYREGQKKLVGSVYKTIQQGKRLFIEAPTGVGKTISAVFPAVWALGEGRAEKIFYGTAKTIARTVAEDAFGILVSRGMKLKCVTITSKEKVCILEKPDCNPVACERACGHFDRVNDAVYDMLLHEELADRVTIEKYAAKHNVCPFEMSLDVATWADAVICDYNYIFDPSAHLRRFFDAGSTGRYCFLIDEAHNLVERARDMYSAGFIKEDFLTAKAVLKGARKGKGDDWKIEAEKDRLAGTLEACNKALLAMKRECDDFEVWEDCDKFAAALSRFVGVYEDISRDLNPEENEAIRDLYFDARHFLDMHESMDGDYTIYTDFTGDRKFRLRLQCMEPRRNLESYLMYSVSSIFFSATLIPVRYYMEQLGGREDDYAVYADSPFDTKRRLLMVGTDVSTKYTRRGEDEYARIARYITEFTQAKKGNYIVFFPSYRLMEDVRELIGDDMPGIVMQERTMREEQKEEFLAAFSEAPDEMRVAFCVMGGIFAEGIDLQGDRLIGVVVVGTGLPMVCNERELFRGYFDEKKHMGFEYSYLYSGMNKVMQAAGRVIRTADDVGAILLLDERFATRQYLELFPREWADWERVSIDTVGRKLEEFWGSVGTR